MTWSKINDFKHSLNSSLKRDCLELNNILNIKPLISALISTNTYLINKIKCY